MKDTPDSQKESQEGWEAPEEPGKHPKLKKFGEVAYLIATLPILVPGFIAYAAAVNVCAIGEQKASGKAKKLFERGGDRLRKMK